MSPEEPDKPIALDVYEQIAEHYAAVVDTKGHNAYYERPTTLSLMPEVNGMKVLDAGCGPGFYSEWVIERGGEVISVDVSPKMIELARKRLGNAADIRLADLRKPLDFIDNASIDVVMSGLALDYVRDWNILFREFGRILKPAGHFVFSFGHPLADYIHSETDNYMSIEKFDCRWPSFGITMPSYRRPLGVTFSALYSAGFVLEKLLEPLPTKECKLREPEVYERLCRRPEFLCIRARKKG